MDKSTEEIDVIRADLAAKFNEFPIDPETEINGKHEVLVKISESPRGDVYVNPDGFLLVYDSTIKSLELLLKVDDYEKYKEEARVALKREREALEARLKHLEEE